jgi:hypothetical protein
MLISSLREHFVLWLQLPDLIDPKVKRRPIKKVIERMGHFEHGNMACHRLLLSP